jgi:hypothetical protein
MIQIRDGQSPRRALRLFVADFSAALLLFAMLSGVFSITHGNAFPGPPPPDLVALSAPTAQLVQAAVQPAMVVASPAIVTTPTEAARPQLMVLLALALASLMAANMALWRHLRVVYAAPQRGAARNSVEAR